MDEAVSVYDNERHDRVRQNTDAEVNQRIDEQTMRRLRLYLKAGPEEITRRIEELDREWDMERLLETNAAAFGLGGVVLGAVISRKWLLLSAVVGGFLLQHAIQGWCPPVPAFRRLGVRTRKEIERERTALKLIRGDFDGIRAEETNFRQIIQAID